MAKTLCSLGILLFFCSLFLKSETSHFVYNGFNGSNIVLDGYARIKDKALKLTDRSKNVIGRAFYRSQIPMSGNSSPNAISFSTHFVFQIVPSDTNRGGYGFAFILSPSTQLSGDGGQFLGVVNPSNDGNSSNHLFMVEFDTVSGHNQKSDRYGNHIGININGLNSIYSESASYYNGLTQRKEDIDLEDENPIQAWIDYDGLAVNVTVAPFPTISKPIKPLLSLPINLSKVMKDFMFAGFSASTGKRASSHYILGWSFKLNGIADPLDVSQISAIPAEKSSSSQNKLKRALITTFSVVLFLLVLALISIFTYRKVMKFEVLEDWELDCPHRFQYKDLYVATKRFNESEIIGVGGFGTVYKGVLQATGAQVAVKKITSNDTLKGTREFAAEIESLGRLRHKNLVNLQGWCKYKRNLLLVYDYVPNGSLHSLLYSSMGTVLSWEQRFNIIKGVASGLLYLHEEWEKVVIHRDVKSSNVLIDRDMNARLGDFGLARLYDHGQNSHTTNVVGTIGYIAPELTRTGKASKGTDVFAYGILLLEIACGRAPVTYEPDRNAILVDRILDCIQTGNILNAVDSKLNSTYAIEEMELVLGLGLLCSHRKPESRPTMKEVIRYLNRDEILPVFDKLNSVGSKRADLIRSRFMALGLADDSIVTTSSIPSSSAGEMSTSSFEISGR
ncbi:lectin-domain containing receptor kinase -like [Olea europaea subsp. europaea]|uniref:non-specific serine/threonine protein kinase n=1 Tax=Olea europaea subsp. europaea TaxID=158383 RepID=A0A8S0UDU7_OLEEU|nr:lectin-domain containing receptor kinase -like [Olea europaea subsp. europaea]